MTNRPDDGDPARVAEIVFELASSDNVPLRLPLGGDAHTAVTDAYMSRLANARAYRDMAYSIAFDAPPIAVAPKSATE